MLFMQQGKQALNYVYLIPDLLLSQIFQIAVVYFLITVTYDFKATNLYPVIKKHPPGKVDAYINQCETRNKNSLLFYELHRCTAMLVYKTQEVKTWCQVSNINRHCGTRSGYSCCGCYIPAHCISNKVGSITL